MNEKPTREEITMKEGLPFGRTSPVEVLEQIGKDGLSGGIKEVCMFPTYRCNLSCYMCHVQHTRKKEKTELSADDLKATFDHLNVETMFHLGGESFVRKDVMDIFKYIDSLGTKQIISTNGTMITEDLAKELASLDNLVCMQVSLNGVGDVDDNIRGKPGAFEKTVNAIKLLQSVGIPTWIHAVILNENVHELPKIVKLGAELGVGMVNFLFGQVMSKAEAEETKLPKTPS
jgi:MoaA/NifB/PqqE/SkfB family radical SAM enzyme